MMHENDEVLKLTKLLAKRVLELEECAKTSTKDECMDRFALNDVAYMARLVTAELGDIEELKFNLHPCHGCTKDCRYALKTTDPACSGCIARVDN
jgi:hypothetical protein